MTGEVVRGGGRELLADHDQAAVAGEADDLLVGHRDLGADRRRQAEAHRPEAAGVEPPVGLGEVVVLRRPHLVLADVGGDDRVAVGRAVHLLDHELRLDLGVGRVLVAERVLLLPAADPLPPLVEAGALGALGAVLAGQLRQHVLARRRRSGCGRGRSCEISAGSTSMWTNLARGANSLSLPVIRSSKRAPIATIRSASSIA